MSDGSLTIVIAAASAGIGFLMLGNYKQYVDNTNYFSAALVLIIIAIIILIIMIQRKWHMNMETERVSYPNPYYNFCKKTEEHNIEDVLNNSGSGQEEIYEPLSEELVPYDVLHLSEKPVLPKREIRASSFAVMKHENTVHLPPNTRKFLLSSDTQNNTSVTQYENVAGSLLTSSQHENVPSPYFITDGSKPPVDSTNNDSPYHENIQPPIAPNKDAVISANETDEDDYVSMKSVINHEPDATYLQIIDD